jgi:3-oxoadipate enol-lactonase
VPDDPAAIVDDAVPGQPRLAVSLRAGEGGAGTVVFLHGIGGNRHNWHEQLAALPPQWQGAAPDLRGYGDSDAYDGRFTFADASADVLRLVDHLRAERVYLVGLSLGGRIALDFAGRYPHRLAGLVLADTSAGMPASRDPAVIAEVLAARRRPLVEQGLSPADIAPGLARGLAGPHCSPEALARIEASLAALHRDAYLNTLETATTSHDFPAFSQLRLPVLVLSGEHDRIAPPAAARQVASEIEGAEFAVIPQAGHLSNIERPEAFSAKLHDFLHRRVVPA